MRHENVAIAIPCLRIVGSITTGDDNQTDVAIQANLISTLNELLSNPKKLVRKEACWVLSNITAGTSEQLKLCIDAGIIDKLVVILQNDEIQIKNEAVWALSNCTASANPQQLKIIIERGIIKALGCLLKINDPKILSVALEGLENILAGGEKNFKTENGENYFAIVMETHGCIDDVEQLKQHPNHSIYQQATKIIDKYFSDEQEKVSQFSAAFNNGWIPNKPGKGLFYF